MCLREPVGRETLGAGAGGPWSWTALEPVTFERRSDALTSAGELNSFRFTLASRVRNADHLGAGSEGAK